MQGIRPGVHFKAGLAGLVRGSKALFPGHQVDGSKLRVKLKHLVVLLFLLRELEEKSHNDVANHPLYGHISGPSIRFG